MTKDLATKIKSQVRKYDLEINNEVALKKIEMAISDLNQKKDWNTKQKVMQTENDWQICHLSLYGSLQKMRDLGIDINRSGDWFINNYGKQLTAQYMYPALLNSIKSKGLICLPKFYHIWRDEKILIKEDDKGSIGIEYTPDLDRPTITIENLNEFKKFICVIRIKNLNNELIHSDYKMLGVDDILKRKAKSTAKDKGEEVWNYKLKRKAPKEDQSIWEEWTEAMIDKSLIIATLSKVKHTLPELKQAMLKFGDLEDDICGSEKTEPEDLEPVNVEVVDFDKPSKEILEKVKQIEEEYKITPELLAHNKKIIHEGLEICQNAEQKKLLINRNFAEILSFGEESKDKLMKFAGV